jgi:arylsulfatase A-like enzyme
VQGYLASITFADEQVGRLMNALENSEYKNNTAIVLWSDHGWHLGEKQHWRKFALWEESTRVVLMASVPGVTRGGSRCSRTVSLMDLYPTLNEACGLPTRPELEGTSLLPLLRNPAVSWNRAALCTYQRGNHSVRDERWRYTRYNDGGEELYDHSSDKMEWTNLADKPEVAKIKAELRKWLPKTDAPDSPVQKGAAEQPA